MIDNPLIDVLHAYIQDIKHQNTDYPLFLHWGNLDTTVKNVLRRCGLT